MKNKLSREELILKEKLNQVSFDYDESHWKEIEQTVSNKPASSSYNSLLKAIAGVTIIAIGAYFLNRYYDQTVAEPPVLVQQQEKQMPEEQNNSSDNQITRPDQGKIQVTEQLNEEEQIAVEQNNEEENVQAENVNSNKGVKELVRNIVEVSHDESASIPEVDLTEESNSSEVKPLATNKVEAFNGNIVYNGHLCQHERLLLSLDHPIKTSQVHYQWKVNGEVQASQTHQLEYFTSDLGALNVELRIIQEEKVLHKIVENYQLKTAVLPEFRYDDLQDPFYDLSVKFNVENKQEGEYTWHLYEQNQQLNGENASYTFETKGIYEVGLKHKALNGCHTELIIPVAVREDFDPFAPTAFSPNGDGNNDEFIIESFGLRDDRFEMKIYSADGTLVFRTTSSQEGWNGRKNNSGELLPRSSYVWKVMIENKEGIQKYFVGSVKLINL